jgi:hypothetical protein
LDLKSFVPLVPVAQMVREFLYLDKAKQNRVTLEDFRAAYETTVHGKVIEAAFRLVDQDGDKILTLDEVLNAGSVFRAMKMWQSVASRTESELTSQQLHDLQLFYGAVGPTAMVAPGLPQPAVEFTGLVSGVRAIEDAWLKKWVSSRKYSKDRLLKQTTMAELNEAATPKLKTRGTGFSGTWEAEAAVARAGGPGRTPDRVLAESAKSERPPLDQLSALQAEATHPTYQL